MARVLRSELDYPLTNGRYKHTARALEKKEKFCEESRGAALGYDFQVPASARPTLSQRSEVAQRLQATFTSRRFGLLSPALVHSRSFPFSFFCLARVCNASACLREPERESKGMHTNRRGMNGKKSRGRERAESAREEEEDRRPETRTSATQTTFPQPRLVSHWCNVVFVAEFPRAPS